MILRHSSVVQGSWQYLAAHLLLDHMPLNRVNEYSVSTTQNGEAGYCPKGSEYPIFGFSGSIIH